LNKAAQAEQDRLDAFWTAKQRATEAAAVEAATKKAEALL
jgi:hypothetical protein